MSPTEPLIIEVVGILYGASILTLFLEIEMSRKVSTGVVVGAIGIGVIGTLGAAVLGSSVSENSDLPGWLEALATFGALIAAAVAAFFAVKAYGIESARDEERREADRRVQAALVAAWFDGQVHYSVGTKDPQTGELKRTGVREAVVLLRNASPVPVSNVSTVAVLVADAPGRRIEHWLGDHRVGLLPPTEQPKPVVVPAVTPFVFDEHHVTEAECVFDVEFSLRFRDSAGRDWIRTGKGELQEVANLGG